MRVSVDSGLSLVLEIRVRCEITKETEEETSCSVHSLTECIIDVYLVDRCTKKREISIRKGSILLF